MADVVIKPVLKKYTTFLFIKEHLYKPHEAQKVWMRMNKWQSVNRREARFVMNLSWFKKQGLYLGCCLRKPIFG
jgi:hypothetical protein